MIYKTHTKPTQTPLKTTGELRCSERVSNSCSTSGTCRVNLVINVLTFETFLYVTITSGHHIH